MRQETGDQDTKKTKFEEREDDRRLILLVHEVCFCLKQFSLVGHIAGHLRQEARDMRHKTGDGRSETSDMK